MSHARQLTSNLLFLVATAAVVLFASAMNTSQVSALASCNNCVDTGDIINGTIRSIDIANSTITNLDLANDSVASTEIRANAVGGSEIVSNSVDSTDLADNIAVTTLSANAISVGALFNTDFLNLGNSVVTDIPDNGTAAAATFTLDSAASWAYLGLNCLDASGCDVTLGNDFTDGDLMFMYNAGTNTINFADTAGVSELAGNFAMGGWDTLQLIYRDNGANNSWIETSRSNN